MVATLQKGYVVVALAFVLLVGTLGWASMGIAASLHHSGAIHTTQQLTGLHLHPQLNCPPPPYNCQGG